MKIPSKEDCYQFMHEMKILDNIAAHSFQVSRVALLITDNLNKKSEFLDRDLVMSSAMLHDITKTRSIETGEMHAETGAIYIREKGYPEVADIVRQHVHIDNFREDDPVNEIEIVNYADRRVLHDKIAILEERMNYIIERYGTNSERRKKLYELQDLSIVLERKIFRNISFHPNELIQHILPAEPSFELENYEKWVSAQKI